MGKTMTTFDMDDHIYSDNPECDGLEDAITVSEDMQPLLPPWWMFTIEALRRDVSGLTSNARRALPSLYQRRLLRPLQRYLPR